MKVLLVNCVYAHGSTGKIVVDIEKGLKEAGVEVCVAYGRGKHIYKKGIYKLAPEYVFKIQSLLSKITGNGYDCSPFSTNKFFSLIKKENPDVVNIHCVNANTLNLAQTIAYLKKNRIKSILTIHAEFPYTGGCGYALDCSLWKTGCHHCPQFKKIDSQCPDSFFFDKTEHEWNQLEKAYLDFKQLTVTCVSPWLTARAKLSPFFQGRSVISIPNGLDTDIFHPKSVERLKNTLGLKNEKIILHVTPNFYSSIKGGRYVIEVANRLKKDHSNCKIIIIGYNGNGNDLPDNIIPIRFTQNQNELAEYYSLADITLLTSKKETFSMVCAESLSCGTPIVGFKAGGPESISIPAHSCFVEHGNFVALYENLLKWLCHKEKHSINIAEAQAMYSLQTMSAKYLEAFKLELSE